MLFEPTKNNVVFASASDLWAFTVQDFSNIWANRFKIPKQAFTPYLWGEYYFDPKTKKVSKKPLNDKHNVMFIEFVLKNLNVVYDKILINPVEDEEVK